MHVDKSLSLRLLSMAALFVAVTWTVASAQTTDPQANPAPARPAAKAVKPVKPPAAARIPPRGVPPTQQRCKRSGPMFPPTGERASSAAELDYRR